MKRRFICIFFALFFALLFIIAFWYSLKFFPDPLEKNFAADRDWSVKIVDRHGELLKEYLSLQETRRNDLTLDKFSPHLINAVLAAEDKRFYKHYGVDTLAVLRALYFNIRWGKIVNGASTITMQLARINAGLSTSDRSFKRKIKEACLALLIERHHSKEEILRAYLNRVPCGNMAEGFPAASKVYLNKTVEILSPSEAAFLSALPQAPGALNPYKDPRPALARRSLIIKKMKKLGFLTPDEEKRAQAEAIALDRFKSPFLAPHFSSYVQKNWGTLPPLEIVTSLDLNLQKEIENLAYQTVERNKHLGLNQVAVLVLEKKSRKILAWVGSVDFFDSKEGQNDGVLALRQPGSILKPFTYGLAFEKGLKASDLIDDRPSVFAQEEGSFVPTNYSEKFHHQVSARVALASSFNIPALKLTAILGVSELLNTLLELGFTDLDEDADYYGLALTLGSGSTNLLTVTTAYAALADNGYYEKASFLNDDLGEGKLRKQVFSSQGTYLVSDILSDDLARAAGFGRDNVLKTKYPSAVKTGTSKNFRDNWCVGYTDKVIVGVWAGNFDASPMGEVSGVTGAGRLWRQVMDEINESYPGEEFKIPKGVIEKKLCSVTGLLASPNCSNQVREVFIYKFALPKLCDLNRKEHDAKSAPHLVLGRPKKLSILSPGNQSYYSYDASRGDNFQKMRFLAHTGPQAEEIIWVLNNQEVARYPVEANSRTEFFYQVYPKRWQVKVYELVNNEIIAEDEITVFVK